jgi:2-oxoacid:acceptor oxidoreductase delta subunit (pyruvate/2-ketoisovalerate family)
MGELRPWQALAAGGTLAPAEVERPVTGGWRSDLRPEADLGRCVNCLLCWVYCPDSAVVLDGETFIGFDLDHCKGCEICAEACPTGAIAMVADDE